MIMDSRLNDEALVGNSNPLVYMVQNEEIGATSVAYCDQINRSSYSNVIDNRVLSSESDVFQYQLDGAVVELEPKFTEFGSGSVLKRKRFDDAYQLTPSQSVDIEHGRNEISEYASEDNLAQKSVSKSCCKKASNSVIHSTNSTEDGKKDYVQVRAKRGEATSRHSLAERIRRERISERMKVLQDLVPGCNKITGKAIMLDEIINYVLSLQHQVEFLSMKLATVDPRQKSGIDQFLLEDIHHSQGGNAANVDNLELGFYSLPDNVSQVPLPTLAPIPNVSLFEPQMFINHKQCSDSNNLLLVSNSKSMERDEPRKEPNGFRL